MSRSYVQTNRAAATQQTRRRILDATVTLVRDGGSIDFTLADVAAAAQVTVQTVLRQFGSREGLFDAALMHASEQVAAERAASPGDPDAAITVLFDHYERWGRAMLRLLSVDSADARAATEQGRRMHREWVRHVFGLTGTGHDATTDLLVVATDLYTWRLLTLDMGLARQTAEQRVRHLVAAILGATR